MAFPPQQHKNFLGEVLSQHHLKQLRIAKTEKYAHVTFFFNGGVETPFPGEDRELIPSPKVATYDLQLEMSAPELTEKLVTAIKSKQYTAIICNYANPDMVGHTGNLEATIKAIETIDHCLEKAISAAQQVGGEAMITADHGNAEKMFDDNTGQPHTAHTSDPVPFIYVGRKASITKTNGALSDLAPTMLYLLGKPNSEVQLTIARKGDAKPLQMNLTREMIKVASVKSEMLPDGYGYLRITQFQENTGKNARIAIAKLEREHHGKLNGMILDLRNNPDGLLKTAVTISDLFIDSQKANQYDNVIVSTKGHYPRHCCRKFRYEQSQS